jgi:hypothetical protein
MYKATLVVLAGLSIQGCETMLPHTRLADNNTTAIAANTAMASICVNNGLMAPSRAAEFNRAAAQVLDATVEDKALFSREYTSSLTEMRSLPRTELAGYCHRQATEIFPEFIPMMNRWVQRAGDWQREGYSILGAQIPATRDYSRNPIPVTMPSGEVTFGFPENNSTNVFVRTSTGFSTCNITNGIAMCF